MLKRARFQNYRSLQDVTIDFGPLTVLVGPNGSGKSSVLHGLMGRGDFQLPKEAWRHARDVVVRVEQDFGDGKPFVRELDPRRGMNMTPARGAAQLVHLDLNAVRSGNQTNRASRLAENGENLTNAFDTLTRKQQGELASQFSKLVPTFADVEVAPHGTGHQILRFQDRWNSDAWYSPDEVSDGTMLLLAYMVLQYQNPQVDLLLVEEPERGLHPYLLGSLVSFLRRMTRGEIGPRAVQIVLATHSADLLDHLEPDEVRLLTRDSSSGSVRVDRVPTDTEAWQETYRTYDESLGLVWKSGGLRGVPGG